MCVHWVLVLLCFLFECSSKAFFPEQQPANGSRAIEKEHLHIQTHAQMHTSFQFEMSMY